MKKGFQVFITTVNVVLVLVLVLILAKPGQKPKVVEVKIANVEDISSLPYWVAYEKGIFQKYGLKFKPNEVSKVLDEFENTIKGAIYASFGLDYTYLLTKSSGDLKLVRILYYSYSNSDGLVFKDTTLNPNNLAGLRIGYNENTRYNVILQAFLGNVENVDLIGLTLDEMESAIESRRVDAIYTFEPLLSYFEKKGYRVYRNVVFKKVPVVLGVGLSSAVNTSLRKEEIKRLKQVLMEAIDYINSNPDEAKRVFSKYTNLHTDLPKFKLANDVKEISEFNNYISSKNLIPYKIVNFESITSEK